MTISRRAARRNALVASDMTVIDLVMLFATVILGLMTSIAVVGMSLYLIIHDYKAKRKKRVESNSK